MAYDGIYDIYIYASRHDICGVDITRPPVHDSIRCNQAGVIDGDSRMQHMHSQDARAD